MGWGAHHFEVGQLAGPGQWDGQGVGLRHGQGHRVARPRKERDLVVVMVVKR